MLGDALFALSPFGFFLVPGLGQARHQVLFRFLRLPEPPGHFRHIRRPQGSRFPSGLVQAAGVPARIHTGHGLPRRDHITFTHVQSFQPGRKFRRHRVDHAVQHGPGADRPSAVQPPPANGQQNEQHSQRDDKPQPAKQPPHRGLFPRGHFQIQGFRHTCLGRSKCQKNRSGKNMQILYQRRETALYKPGPDAYKGEASRAARNDASGNHAPEQEKSCPSCS